jgi:hypothetical protein
VQSLIDFNAKKFKGLDVEFKVLDLTKDELPGGDIVILRQVLQHLPNSAILRALPEIIAKYKYILLTEHLPPDEDFVHNLDKPPGPDIRLSRGSGVVLTSPPFYLRAVSVCLCQSKEPVFGGIIRTDVYSPQTDA